MTDLLILVIVGLFAGLLGGLLGVGGSVLMIPAIMILFKDANQHVTQGAAMIVNFFVVWPAVVQHRRADAVLWPIVRAMAPFAVIGVVVGVWLSDGRWFRGSNEVYLSRVFGAFLLYDVGYNVYRLLSNKRLPDVTPADAASIPAWKTAAAVGLPMGLVGGLLGVGGGALAVPLQQVFLRIPLRRAIANSAAAIVALSVIGATYKNYANHQAGLPLALSLRWAACLIPTAMIGGFLGARLTHAIPRRFLRIAFSLLMCYASVSLLRREPKNAGAGPTPASAPTTSRATSAP